MKLFILALLFSVNCYGQVIVIDVPGQISAYEIVDSSYQVHYYFRTGEIKMITGHGSDRNVTYIYLPKLFNAFIQVEEKVQELEARIKELESMKLNLRTRNTR